MSCSPAIRSATVAVVVHSRLFESHIRPAQNSLTKIVEAMIYVAHDFIGVLETTQKCGMSLTQTFLEFFISGCWNCVPGTLQLTRQWS